MPTMIRILNELLAHGVDYTNIYALADSHMSRAIQRAQGGPTKILGLTVLTHYDEAYCQRHRFCPTALLSQPASPQASAHQHD